MTTIDLIKRFIVNANWNKYAADGHPSNGFKWLTVKQVETLYCLFKKDYPEEITNFDSFVLTVYGYEVKLGETAKNGRRFIKFKNLQEN
jgi:hypothetical protein